MNKTFKIKVTQYVYQKADTADQAVSRAKRKGYIRPGALVESAIIEKY